MAQDTDTSTGGWLDACGLLPILRTLGLAVHPTKLAIALMAIVLTFALGTVLDAVWRTRGGVDAEAVARFIQARELDQRYEEPADGKYGVFHVWRVHERRCIRSLLGSALPGRSAAFGTPLGNYVVPPGRGGALRSLVDMVYGVRWLLECHTLYFILFAIGGLIIWSFCGGAICRIAAVQFARDEQLTMRQGLSYAASRLFGGFFLAPCIPLFFIVLLVVLLVIGGMFLRMPVLGDVVGGLVFGLAIFAGFLIALLLIGLLVGGHLFWPAVAAEGADAFDAFSRGLAYPFSKPIKTILYAIIAVVFASVCWVFANLFTYLMLAVTRAAVGFGTSPFGWWARTVGDHTVRKLDLLWPLAGPESLYDFPKWSNLSVFEHVSAALIGIYVLLVIGLLWSFLASFYFSGSTVVYFLLRRDVDATDLQDVFDETQEQEPEASQTPGTGPSEISTTTPSQGLDTPTAAPGTETGGTPGPSPGTTSEG